MNTTTINKHHVQVSRTGERLVAGQATSDGAGVKLTRVLTQNLQHRLDPFLMLDAFGSDAASDDVGGFPDHPHRGFATVTLLPAGRVRPPVSPGIVGLLVPGPAQSPPPRCRLVPSPITARKAGRKQAAQGAVIPAAR